MSKEHVNPRTITKAIQIADYHLQELQEMAKDIGKQMMDDQAEWLDKQMKDILPPKLYGYGKRGQKEKEIGEYMAKHRIKLVHIPDSLVIRIMIGERVHSQFVPKFTVDGEPVTLTPSQFIPDVSQN